MAHCESHDTRFRLVTIQTQTPPVAGFALWYQSKGGATSLFNAVRDYFEDRSSCRRLDIRFESAPADRSSYQLAICIESLSTRFDVLVDAVPQTEVDVLRAA